MLVKRYLLFAITLSIKWYKHVALQFQWSRNDTTALSILQMLCLREVIKVVIVLGWLPHIKFGPPPKIIRIFLEVWQIYLQIWKISSIPIFNVVFTASLVLTSCDLKWPLPSFFLLIWQILIPSVKVSIIPILRWSIYK